MKRELQVIISRLRLGYKCSWQIIENATPEICTNCMQNKQNTLLHYLLQCDATSALRNIVGIPRTNPTEYRASELGAQMVRKIISEINVTKQTILRIKPPR